MVQFLRQAARRSRRGGDQADALPHQPGQPDRQGADRGGGSGQIGHRAGRAQGALRRGGQHQMGARPGARRRAGGLWLHRAQDPRQSQPGGAARRRRAAHLCAFRHRQLPPRHRQDLYRPVAVHRRPGAGPRCGAAVQFHHRLCRAGRLEKLSISPLTLRGRLVDAIQQEIDACPRRPARGDLGQAQFAGRSRR